MDDRIAYALLRIDTRPAGPAPARRRSGEIGIRSRLKSRLVFSGPLSAAPYRFEFISVPIQVLLVPEFDTE